MRWFRRPHYTLYVKSSSSPEETMVMSRIRLEDRAYMAPLPQARVHFKDGKVPVVSIGHSPTNDAFLLPRRHYKVMKIWKMSHTEVALRKPEPLEAHGSRGEYRMSWLLKRRGCDIDLRISSGTAKNSPVEKWTRKMQSFEEIYLHPILRLFWWRCRLEGLIAIVGTLCLRLNTNCSPWDTIAGAQKKNE